MPLYEQFDAAAVEQYRQQGARWLLLNRLTIPDDKADNLPYQTIGWNRTGALLGAADKSSEHPDERLTRLLKELAARYPCIQPAGESFVILDLRGS